MDDTTVSNIDRDAAIARLEAIQEIQSTVGWMWFIGEIHAELGIVTEDLKVAMGEQTVGRLQGRADAFAQIIDFEDTVDLMLASLRNPDEGDDDAAV